MEQRFLLELDGRLAGRLFSAAGGMAKVSYAEESPHRNKQISTVELDPLTMEFGTGMSRAFYEWVGGALDSRIHLRKSGSVTSFDTSSKPTSRLEFLDALITNLSFPDLDVSSSKDAVIRLKMQPERTRVQKETAASLGVYTSSLANAWTVNHFRLSIDGLHTDCTQVKRILGLQVIQGFKKMYTGQERFPTIEPTKMEFRGITVEVPVGFGKEFQQWHTAAQDRKMSYGLEKNGAIEFLAPGSRNPYFVLNLSGIEILSVQKKAHGVSVDLIFKGMSLKPGGAAIK